MTYEELKNLVIKHCHLYYDKSAPEISDAEFDKLYDNLAKVEVEQGWADADSPTNKVGGSVGKVKHPYKLYSLRKVYDIEEVDDFFDVKTPKIDGTNLTLIYKNGKLALALTRGNGEAGENVIHLAKHITNIPQKINTGFSSVVINGECVTDNDVENFRNYVSGALGLKDANEFKTRNIKFIAHDMLGIQLNYTKRMELVKNMGITTVFSDAVSNYPHDGIVYRIDSYNKSVQLGYTAKYPKFAVALKPRGEATAITTLQDVIWAVGRTGTVNPTGIIDPVIIDDAKISRVTLHNIGIIEEFNLGLGDTIEIERAGGVIPKFTRVIEHSKHNNKITQKHAEVAIGTTTRREGPKLFVKDKSASSDIKLLEYFIKTLDIKGLGPASVTKLNFTHPVDLFEENIDWTVLGVNGIKVSEEVRKAKSKPYETVLAALGIPGVGKTTASLIVKYIPKFCNLRDIAHMEIKGIGPSTTNSILEWLEDNETWAEQLPLQLEQTIHVEELISKESKKVCITGKLDMSRNDLQDILEAKGYKVTSTVTKDCYALITGGDNTSSKYKKAASLNIKIIDYWANQKDVVSGNF